ncbi:MAG: hypothetical protein PVH61_26290 [Candidatus Aminicenantes bacterium]
MSDLIKTSEILDTEKKNKIIRDVRQIEIKTELKTQAQNLRELSTKTESIEEILLYLEYQCAREKKWKLNDVGAKLKQKINEYKNDDIEVIRYLLGTFARWVLIESKRGE